MIGFLQKLIKLYQNIVSPFLGHHCRFYPTCSTYAQEALEKHGIFCGLILTGYRLIRCGPWSHSNWIDPVPSTFAWDRVLRYKRRQCKSCDGLNKQSAKDPT